MAQFCTKPLDKESTQIFFKMKYTTTIGLLLLAIGVSLFYFADLDMDRIMLSKDFIVGIFLGCGFGFLVGGFLGWLYKRKKIAKETKPSNIPAETKTEETITKQEDDSGLI